MRMTHGILWTAAVAGVMVMAGGAAWAVGRPNELRAEDVVGVYRNEPAARGNPTTTLQFVRFQRNGKAYLEFVKLHDDGVRFSPEANALADRPRGWRLEGSRLCLTERTTRCFDAERDEVTGDLALEGGQRLTRIRSEAYDYK